MADQPSTSRASTKKGVLLQNIRQEFLNNAKNIESARFLKRIIQKADEQYAKLAKTDVLDRAHFFTGLDKRIFPNIDANVKITQLKEIERSLVHERYITFYLNSSRFCPRTDTAPTTKNLYASLYGKIPHYVDIRTFRKYLVKMGYGWLRLAKAYIVIEKPSVTFERYYYLKDIIRFREENREIFYVDEAVLTNTCSYYDVQKYVSLMKAAYDAKVEIWQRSLTKCVYAVSKTGVKALMALPDFTECNFEKWIANDLVPALPPNSVVVIKNNIYHGKPTEKPTLYSIKADMIKWLQCNNVPYDENMSKCELMSLIDTYTSESDGTCKIESILKVNGHELLRLPFSIEEMTPAKFLFDLIKLNAPTDMKVKCEAGLRSLIDAVSPETFEEYDQNIAEYEKETLAIDMKMDEVFDRVIRDMQNIRVNLNEDSEVPLSDSD